MKKSDFLQVFAEEAASDAPADAGQEEQAGSAEPSVSQNAEQTLSRLQPAIDALIARLGLDPDAPDYEKLSEAVCRQLSPEAGFHRHFEHLQRQAEALQAQIPGFSLEQMMQNAAFLHLTAPGGVSVADAYFALNRAQIQQATLHAALRSAVVCLSNAIRSGTLRPREAGTAAQAPTVTTIDYRSATPEQREAIRRRIREGWARGENINPF